MLLASALACALALPDLQPKTYASSSGLWTLHVEPRTRSGTGEADYVLTGGGKEAWKKTLPFALWDAVVTNDGRVAGYAYSGAEIDALSGGSLRVVILSPKGEVLLEENHEREPGRFEHQTANPKAVGIFVQEDIHRFVVRVGDEDLDRRCSEWWVYDTGTGESLLRARPKEKLGLWNGKFDFSNPVGHEIDIRPVLGTPLVLAQWWRYDSQVTPRSSGCLFALLDPDLRLVWKLELPADYSIPGDEDAEDRLRDEIWKDGAVLFTSTPKQFELRLVAEGMRVTYSVESTPDGAFRVEEIARRPYVADGSPTKPAIPVVKPRLLTERQLAEAGPPSAEIRDIKAFDFDSESHFRVVRSEREAGTATLLLVDGTGRILSSMRVGPLEVENENRLDWFALESPRWIAIESTLGQGTSARAWIVDERSGDAHALPDFSAQDVQALAPLGPDRFVLLSSWHFKYGITKGLVACDLGGKVLWRVDQDHPDPDEEAQLFSPEDLTVTTDRRVVVLENIRKRLQFFDPSGKYLTSLDLSAVLGRTPNYPAGLEPDVAGGLLFEDFGGEPPLWRLESDGTPRAKLDPRRADGTATRSYRDRAKVSPDGLVWTTDGSVLLRLDDNGIVDLVLGDDASADHLGEVGACALDSTFGRVLVQDRRTRAVHVFDAEGRRISVCRPAPGEVDAFVFPLELSTTQTGEVFAADSRYTSEYLRFDATGKSLGAQRMRSANVAFLANSTAYWGSDGKALLLSAGEKKPRIRLEKRPDGQWFRSIEEVRTGSDGSVAVLDVPEFERNHPPPEDRDSMVVLLSDRGEPLRSLPVPEGFQPAGMAYAPGWVLLDDYHRTLLVNAGDGSTRELDLAQWIPAKGGAVFGLSPDGREIWVLTYSECRFLRFARPE